MVYCNTLASKYDVQTASEHIDILTHNRIWQIGWDNLTQYQKRVVSRVCEKLAIFEYENKHDLDGSASSVSISGISMTFNDFSGDAYYKECGVVIKRSDYDLLITTGLCSRIL